MTLTTQDLTDFMARRAHEVARALAYRTDYEAAGYVLRIAMLVERGAALHVLHNHFRNAQADCTMGETRFLVSDLWSQYRNMSAEVA